MRENGHSALTYLQLKTRHFSTKIIIFYCILLQVDDTMNELEGIDLKDPDLNKAATKIQASFRGHKVRQEVTQEIKK